ncbi:MAG: hypothetical protein A3H98_14325 [Bacteroidetes bacterium RIFCSPLOWO2_02_FULL_36_8]|nr:MAG: hypothetical protein A3H98_14325 [Bacteroidetes bacterium RIFCSPLOWO2_02_FULL_36_8]OFY72026.1 MAG: hypothetical protein A3G23_00330 [Bacteroidetes bacterium RIFCSPLOWO2_12_FULL_37_12]
MRSLNFLAPTVKIGYDRFGRAVKTETEGFNESVFSVKTYNEKGLITSSTPSFGQSGTTVTTTYVYDDFGRINSETNSIGYTTYDYTPGSTEVTVTNQPSGHFSKKKTDAGGKLITAEDDGGTITYTYFSDGNVKDITNGITVATFEYDEYGRQTKLIDANAGTIEYLYNAFGELISQTDAKGTTAMEYDVLGRIITQTGPDGVTVYEYVTSGNGLNQVKKITTPEGNIVSYQYDELGRNTAVTETIDGADYTTTYKYDKFSNPIKTTYPSGFSVDRSFNAKGYFTQINNSADGKFIWKADAMNSFSQYTEFTLGNNVKTYKTFNEYGLVTDIYAGSIQSLSLTWNLTTGNLDERKYNLSDLKESFIYDDLSRLTQSTVNGKPSVTLTYSDNGNIATKTGLGSYIYKRGAPNAVETITLTDEIINQDEEGTATHNIISHNHQDITYTPFNKTKTITENNYELIIQYGAGNARKVTELKQSGVVIKKIIYSGSYEKIIIGSDTYEVHYIAGGDGLTAINVRHNNVDKMYYVYTDHLGSILKLTDESGAVIYEQNYDAWGRERNPVDWTYAPNI